MDATGTPLLLSRRFAPLFWCQFCAAFNDNFLKSSLVFVILFRGATTDGEALITVASGVLIAPYFILSGLGGEIADRYDKSRVARTIKLAEIAVAAVAAVGFARESLPLMFAALAGFGILGAMFGPVKYGILPDLLRREELPAGNALVEGATFVAILLGTSCGGLAVHEHGGAMIFPALVIGFAVAAWLAALFIPATAAGARDLRVDANVAASTLAMLHHLRADRRLWWGAMVSSWFWLVGILVLSLLPPLIKTLLGGDEATVTVALALFTVAVAAGSALAARLSHGRIVLGITVAGAMLIGVFALDLGVATLGLAPAAAMQPPAEALTTALGIRVTADLCGLAVAGGLFIVPAFAAVQAWSDAAYRARTIAGVNVLNAGFMTAATAAVALLQKQGVPLAVLFAGLGVSTLAVAAAVWTTKPKAQELHRKPASPLP